MKSKKVFLTLLPLFVVTLNACNFYSGEGTVFPVPTNPDEKDKRLIKDDEKLVDYSEVTAVESNGFRLSHGYSNHGMFNCYWNRNAAKIEDDVLKMSVYKGSDKYYGAEYRSNSNNFHYGYYATSMKPSNCSGVVSSFFTYTGYPSWHEIDIEFLGKNTRQVQFNYFLDGVGEHEFLYNLWFDASEDFHEYGFEWLEKTITWYIDGFKIYQVKKSIPYYKQALMMNVWNTRGKDDWSGPLDESKLPTEAQYQWIAYIPAN